MTHNKPSRDGRRRSQPKRPDSTHGKRIRVEPTRRQRVDPDMIALCYWLIAQRIVQEADDNRERGVSAAPNASNDHIAADAGAPGGES